jgi:hypothetical protein
VGGLSEERAARNFWVLDRSGLITTARKGVKAPEPHVRPFARVSTEHEGESLIAVVKRVT